MAAMTKRERERMRWLAEWRARPPDIELRQVNGLGRERLWHFAARAFQGLRGQRPKKKEPQNLPYSHIIEVLTDVIGSQDAEYDIRLWYYHRILIDVPDSRDSLQFARVADQYQLAGRHWHRVWSEDPNPESRQPIYEEFQQWAGDGHWLEIARVFALQAKSEIDQKHIVQGIFTPRDTEDRLLVNWARRFLGKFRGVEEKDDLHDGVRADLRQMIREWPLLDQEPSQKEQGTTSTHADWERGQKTLVNNVLIKYFSIDELLDLCARLNIDPEEFNTNRKKSLIRDLIAYVTRRNRLGDLVLAIHEERGEALQSTKDGQLWNAMVAKAKATGNQAGRREG